MSIGVFALVIYDNKIILGKRNYGNFKWTLPGGKQEYNETFFEGAKREVKEETNLDVDELELFDAADDIQPDRHYITMHVIAKKYSGELKVMEPTKEDEWKWFDINDLPSPRAAIKTNTVLVFININNIL